MSDDTFTGAAPGGRGTDAGRPGAAPDRPSGHRSGERENTGRGSAGRKKTGRGNADRRDADLSAAPETAGTASAPPAPVPRGGVGRRGLLRGMAAAGAAGAAAPLVGAGTAGAAPRATGAGAARADGGGKGGPRTPASFRWLGNAGWRIGIGGRTVLFDPFLSRFSTGLFSGAFDERTELTVDHGALAEHAGSPELILVSHGHWDHFADVPHLAERFPAARVVGTETTYHLLRAFGTAADRIIVVKGGEVLDFGGFTVEVVAGLHSRNKRHTYFSPGTLNAVPARPAVIADLVEGDTLAFQVAVEGGPSAFLMGASDVQERAAAGLRPDVAMVAVPSSTSTHRYVPRLLKALGNPGTVVPVHWDVFEAPLGKPARQDPTMDLAGVVSQVRTLSPASRIVIPEYLTPYTF